jgi:parallel beta-helix repeat protein
MPETTEQVESILQEKQEKSTLQEVGRLISPDDVLPGAIRRKHVRDPLRCYTKVVSTDNTGDYQTDGLEDDVEIQAAIDAVEAAGGGVVFIRAGTYVISTELVIDSANVNLIGEGIDATVIQLKAAFPTGEAGIVAGADNISVGMMTIDGNKANQTTESHNGIENGTSTTVYDNCFYDLEVKNINHSSTTGNGIYLVYGERTKIERCHCTGIEGYGFQVNSGVIYTSIVSSFASSNSVHGFLILGAKTMLNNCTAYSNSSSGFYMDSGMGLCGNCVAFQNTVHGFYLTSRDTITGCISEDNTQYGVYTDSTRSKIVGCHLYDNGKHGIYVDGADNCIISGNYIDIFNGLDADNTYSGILLTGTALRNVVVGNRIMQIAGTNNWQYGIREAAAADNYNLIDGNIVTNAQTAQISTQGANTVTGDNVTS